MDSASLVSEIEKKIFWVGTGVFHCLRHNGRVFLRFSLGFLALGSGQMGHLFVPNIFCILDSNTSL